MKIETVHTCSLATLSSTAGFCGTSVWDAATVEGAF